MKTIASSLDFCEGLKNGIFFIPFSKTYLVKKTSQLKPVGKYF